MPRHPSLRPSAEPANDNQDTDEDTLSDSSDNENNDRSEEVVVAPPASPVSDHDELAEQAEEQPVIEPVTLFRAANDLKAFWPFVLRYGISVGADAAKVYIIAQKDIELVGAYTAYNASISLVIGLLYGSIFPLIPLVSAAKHEEDTAEKNNKSDDIEAAREKIRLLWRQGIIFSALLCVPAIIFGLTASPVFKLLDQPAVVLKDSQKYLMYSAPGFVVDMIYRLTARMVTGLGVKKSILVADTLDRVLEIGLAYVFLHGKFGLPELGLPGVAAGYSISKAVTLLGHLLYIYTSPSYFNFDYKKYNLFACDGVFFDKEVFKTLLKQGLPSGLENVLQSISAMFVTMFCGQFGTAPLVGLQVATVYNGFANFHASAALNAMAKLMGQYSEILSNKKGKFRLMTIDAASKNAAAYLKLLYPICVFIAMTACGLTFLIPKQLVGLLIDKNNSAHQSHLTTSIDFLKIQGVFLVISGVQLPSYCGLFGLGFTDLLLYTAIIFDLTMNAGAAAGVRYGLHKNANWVFASTGLGLFLMTCVQLWFLNQKIVGNRVDTQVAPIDDDTRTDDQSVRVTISDGTASQSRFFRSLNADAASQNPGATESTPLLAPS